MPYNQFVQKLEIIEDNSNTAPNNKKINDLLFLKKQFEACKIPEDSVYASILHRLGWLLYLEKKGCK